MRGLAASWVLTGDVDAEPIEDGAVVLDDEGRIVAVGESRALRVQHASAAWEDHSAVLTPGLVNAHTHLELSALRGQVPGGRGFVPWLRAQLDARSRLSPEHDDEALDAAVSELLRTGTVAVGDVGNTLRAVSHLREAPLLGRIFHEIYGVRREAAAAMLERARAEREAVEAFPAHLSYALAPHAMYTVHPGVAREIAARARSDGVRTSLHLAEHPAERAYLQDHGGPFAEFLQERTSAPPDWVPPGSDPLRYAAELGLLAPDVLAVHLTDARESELERVAEVGAAVVLCPRSNLHVSLKLPALLRMLKLGIQPALGTDSLASTPSLDVLEEARALGERFPTVPARTLLAMATSFGADALGLAHRVGRLEPGLSPGVLAFAHGGQRPAEPERFVLSRAARERGVLLRPGGEL